MKTTSRIWAFALSRALEPKTEIEILAGLEDFCNAWTSHNSSVVGSARVYKQRFLLVAADADNISGCSIDGMRKKVIEVLAARSIDLLEDRHVVWTDQKGEWHSLDWLRANDEAKADMKIRANFIFSPYPRTMEEFSSSWPLLAKDSFLLR